MKERKVELIIYIVAACIAIGVVIFDIATKKQPEIFDTESYVREMVESSTIRVNDKIYGGVYEAEELLEIPEGFELIGEIIETFDDVLNQNFESNTITAGTQIYANINDASKIYIKIAQDGYDSYVEYDYREEAAK